MIRGIWRPRVELPEFKRCCFCMPLRYGLLSWGYFKMPFLAIPAFNLIEGLIGISQYTLDVPVMVLFLCVILVDIVFNIIFIVAGHMKHQKLFKTYYYYSLVFLGTFVLGYIIVLGWYFYNLSSETAYEYLWLTFISLYVASPIIMIQTYVALLARSEARKLDNSSNVQFINTAAKASCSLGLNNVENAVEP